MAKAKEHSFLYRNSLSIVVTLTMLIFWSAQFYTGWRDKNEEQQEKNLPQLSVYEYAQSGHFLEATFENWESEFLQMAFYVLLTVVLRQKGSAESKSLDKEEEVDREPKSRPDAPWPVKKGGIWLKLYNHSLSIAFTLLFLLSFVLHFYGSLKEHNAEQMEKLLPPDSWSNYISKPHFWFESFQNWQSEFLAVASIVLLSIWLREKGSHQSKPVDTPNYEN